MWPAESPTVPGRTAGFTLVELLVATAILGLTGAALLMFLNGGTRIGGSAERLAQAAMLLRSELARLDATGRYTPGRESRDLGGGFTERLFVRPFGDDSGSEGGPLGTVLEVSLEIDAGRGIGAHATTLRLAGDNR